MKDLSAKQLLLYNAGYCCFCLRRQDLQFHLVYKLTSFWGLESWIIISIHNTYYYDAEMQISMDNGILYPWNHSRTICQIRSSIISVNVISQHIGLLFVGCQLSMQCDWVQVPVWPDISYLHQICNDTENIFSTGLLWYSIIWEWR